VADIAALAARGKRGLDHTAAVYFRLREALGLDWIEQAIEQLADGGDWHERARFTLAGDLRASHMALAARALAGGARGPGRASPDARLKDWLDANREAVAAIERMTADLRAEHAPDFAMLSVLVAELPRLH